MRRSTIPNESSSHTRHVQKLCVAALCLPCSGCLTHKHTQQSPRTVLCPKKKFFFCWLADLWVDMISSRYYHIYWNLILFVGVCFLVPRCVNSWRSTRTWKFTTQLWAQNWRFSIQRQILFFCVLTKSVLTELQVAEDVLKVKKV